MATKILIGLKKPMAKLTLAFKNLYFSYPLMHATRLVSLLIMIITSMLLCMNTLNNQVAVIDRLLECDYIALAADNKTSKAIEASEVVDSAYYIHITKELMTEKNTGLLGLSVSDSALEYVNPKIAPATNPHENEIAVSSGVAQLCSKKVGDAIQLSYATKYYSFKIVDIIDTSANVVFFDSDYIGLKKDLLYIQTTTDKNSEEFQAFVDVAESRGASLVSSSFVFKDLTSRLHTYSDIVDITIVVAVITTILGVINLIIFSLTTRKREREIYYSIGMTKKEIIKTTVVEISICVIFATLFAAILLPLLLWLLDSLIITWGVDFI